ncbi:MAG: isoprenylcysteine carboxylmethyltransferase family protein [Planctomycetes bacterium]|nr:isoprenylcysteine carboxylmethyltransferase family protein [Planctomycetota bacterium]
MKRSLVLLFGVLSYGVFFFTFVYQIGFVEGMVVPKAMNDGVVLSVTQAVVINLVLLSLFAIQHTIMARLVFKRWWTKIVSEPIERSVFVLLTSLLLLLMNWQWSPLPEHIWQVQGSGGRAALYVISFAGWGLVLYATCVINHFDLFGLRQVWLYFKQREYTQVEFKETVLYRWVRHPIMLGFIIAFWATPDMTQGHLLFAAVTTTYILIGIQIEERTLLALHGENYRRYRERVSMIIPTPPKPMS